MKVSAKSTKRTAHLMTAGVHLAVITDVKYARDEKKQLKKTKDGSTGFEITFKNNENKSISHIFWLTGDAMWLLQKLCDAANIDNRMGEVSVDKVIGSRLFIIVGNEYLVSNGERKKDVAGIEIFSPVLVPIFYPVIDPNQPPILAGDPTRNNGVASGKFAIEKQIFDFAAPEPQAPPVQSGKLKPNESF